MTDQTKNDGTPNAVFSTAGLGGWIVAVGDVLKPIPLWNQTERRENRLPPECEVLAIIKDVCQSGYMLTVRNWSGQLVWLDAEWFEPPNSK